MTFFLKCINTKIKYKTWLLIIAKSCFPMQLSTFFLDLLSCHFYSARCAVMIELWIKYQKLSWTIALCCNIFQKHNRWYNECANMHAHLKWITVTRQLNVISLHTYFPFTVTIRGERGCNCAGKKNLTVHDVTFAAETNHTLYNHKSSL